MAQQGNFRFVRTGSVFKLITCAAALDTGAVTRNSRFVCAGKINVQAQISAAQTGISMAVKPWPRGWRYPATHALSRWGRGWANRTFAITLPPLACAPQPVLTCPARSSAANTIPPTAWAGGAGFLLLRAKQQGELPANDHSRLRGGQRRQADAAHVVQSIRDTERNTVQQVEPTVKAQVIRPETSAVMRELMEGVVTTGTGKNGAWRATVWAAKPAPAKSWTARMSAPALPALWQWHENPQTCCAYLPG